MKHRRQLSRLTAEEAAKARRLTEKHGIDRATRMLGLCDARTLTKAIAQLDVSTLTANVLRARLTDRTI